jgi:hypothetical protein
MKPHTTNTANPIDFPPAPKKRECNPLDCQYIDGLGRRDCDWCRPDTYEQPAQQQEPPDGCVVVARAVLKTLGINDAVIDTIARPTPQPAQRQEPVAWRVRFHYGTDGMAKRIGDWKLCEFLPTPEKDKDVEALYTSPPSPKPLTHLQRLEVLHRFKKYDQDWHGLGILIDLVEAAHNIKD